MKAYRIIVFVVLVISTAQPILSQTPDEFKEILEKNAFDKKIVPPALLQSIQNQFKKHFQNKVPSKKIISELVFMPPKMSYQYFLTLRQHIKQNDEYASYAKSLQEDGQKILDHMLRDIKYNAKIDVVLFMHAAYNAMTFDSVPGYLWNTIWTLNQYMYDLSKDIFKKSNAKVVEKLFNNIVDDTKSSETTDEQNEMLTKQIKDKFQKLFQARTPSKQIIASMADNPLQTNYQLFKKVQKHIENNDEYASYAKNLIAEGQKVFDQLLRDLGYEQNLDLAEFLDAAYNISSGRPVSMEAWNPFWRLNKYMDDFAQDRSSTENQNKLKKLLQILDNNKQNLETRKSSDKRSETTSNVKKGQVTRKKTKITRGKLSANN